MEYCTNCGNKLNGSKYCTKCGARAKSSISTMPAVDESKIADKKTKKNRLLFVSVATILIVALTGAYLGLSYLFNNQDNSFVMVTGNDTYNNDLVSDSYDRDDIDAGTVVNNTYKLNDDLYYAVPDENSIDMEEGIMYVNNEMILHANNETTRETVKALINKYNAEIVGEIRVSGTYQIRFDENYSYDMLQSIIADFEQESFIKWCSTNNIFEYEDNAFYPNDTEWEGKWSTIPSGTNWGAEAIKAPAAWDMWMFMKPVNVGVFDGYFQDHDDLYYTKRYFNFVDLKDDDGHGEHVTGIIGAKFNNDFGIAGIAPKTKLYCFSKCGYWQELGTTMLYESMFTQLIEIDKCKVINISQGKTHEEVFSASRGNENVITSITNTAEEIGRYLQDRILQGHGDFVICVAAGNTNNKIFIEDPNINNKLGYKLYDPKTDSSTAKKLQGNVDATYNNFLNAITIPEVKDRIIVVGSCKNNGNNQYTYSAFSNVGNRVDVVAPGEGILSTVPGSLFDDLGKDRNNRYQEKNGTSMATPHVSGIAAMLFSLDDSLDGADVKAIIVNTAYTSVDGCRYRMINAEEAIKAITVGQTYWVQDANGNKLANVKVNVDNVDNKLNGDYYTDSKGAVSLRFAQGNHKISFIKDGYETYEDTFFYLGAGGFKEATNRSYISTGKVITLIPGDTTETPAQLDLIDRENDLVDDYYSNNIAQGWYTADLNLDEHWSDYWETPRYYSVNIEAISEKQVTFSVEMCGFNSRYIYTVDSITAKINNNVASFEWEDSWENTGYGTITFENDGFWLTMVETYRSDWNRDSLACENLFMYPDALDESFMDAFDVSEIDYDRILMNNGIMDDYILLPDDYDGDGKEEAYVLLGGRSVYDYYDSPYGKSEHIDICLIDSNGDFCVFETLGGYGCYTGQITVPNGKFIVIETNYGGSGSFSYVYGVNKGTPFKLDISGTVGGLCESDGKYVYYANDFSNGHHDYVETELGYNAYTRQLYIK